MKVALCLLTLNEIYGCKKDIPKIKKIKKNFNEIFCVDNGSKDGTIEYLRKNNIKVISKPGISYNMMHDVAVKHSHSDAIIFFPPKGTNSVKDTLKFKKYFESGYEFIVGSRIMKGGKNEEDKHFLKPRKWLTMLLALMSSIRWRKNGNIIWDCLHVFRGITIKSYVKMKIKSDGQTFDIDNVVQSYKKDIKRVEFPTSETARISGETHFKTIPFGIKLAKYFIKEAFS